MMIFRETFPTVIGHHVDKEFTDRLLPIAHEVLDKQSKIGHFGYKTSYGIEDVTQYLRKFDFITEYITQLAKQYTQKIGYQLPQNITISSFISRMTENEYHESHQHPGAILSGLFYLKVEENSAPILFEDPRVIRPFNGMELLDANNLNEYNTYEVSYLPKAGDILIWEAWLKHRVPPNKSSCRETFVFNIGCK